MAYLQLQEIKEHLNIDSCFTDDDNYLMQLAEAAEEAVSNHLNLNFCKLFLVREDLPESIALQIKILVATWYANREGAGVGAKENPLTFGYLAGINRNYDESAYYAYKE